VIALTLLVWWYGLEVYKAAKDYLLQVPFPWSRHYRSSDNCLEGKRGNYQVCSVQYCVQQLCAVQCIHIWTDLTVVRWLDLAFLWLCYVPQCICVRFSFFMVALWNRETIYIFMLWFVLLLSFFFFSSPNLSSRRLDVYHTSAHGVVLV